MKDKFIGYLPIWNVILNIFKWAMRIDFFFIEDGQGGITTEDGEEAMDYIIVEEKFKPLILLFYFSP